MNILSGTIEPSSGTIAMAGKPVFLRSPAAAAVCGIAIVYQEFSSIPELSVADNIYLGREFRGRFGAIDHAAASRAAARLLEVKGIALEPDRIVGTLGVAERQLVELARALATNARVLPSDYEAAHRLTDVRKLFYLHMALRLCGLLVIPWPYGRLYMSFAHDDEACDLMRSALVKAVPLFRSELQGVARAR